MIHPKERGPRVRRTPKAIDCPAGVAFDGGPSGADQTGASPSHGLLLVRAMRQVKASRWIAA
jgi:hypothetical protein